VRAAVASMKTPTKRKKPQPKVNHSARIKQLAERVRNGGIDRDFRDAIAQALALIGEHLAARR
jgi:hypothetical protein